MTRRHTVSDRLLLAALDLSDESPDGSFVAEDLVVRAWRLFPDAFGLRGILDDNGEPMYPDSNRVFVEIMGSKPLRKRGLLVKVGDKRYQVTAAGKRHAASLGERSSPSPRSSIRRDIQESVGKLFRSRAVGKYRDGRFADVTFHDACSFWGISPRSSANDLEARLAHVMAVLSDVLDYAGDGTVALSNGLVLAAEDVQQMLALHFDLMDAYQQELEVIRSRTDER